MNKKLLKTVLTTASLIAVAGATNSAQATATLAISKSSGATNTATKGDFYGADGKSTGALSAGKYSFVITSVADGKDMTIGTDGVNGTINAYGYNNKLVTINGNTTLSLKNDVSQTVQDQVKTAADVANKAAKAAVITSTPGTGASAPKINLSLGAGKTYTAGADISALGTINGAAAGAGTLKVNDDDANFTTQIGQTNAIGGLEVANGRTAGVANAFKATSGAGAEDGKVKLGDGSTLNVGGVANQKFEAVDVYGSADNKGTLKFVANTTEFNSTIGASNALELVDLNLSGTVTFKGDVLKAKTTNFSGDATLDFAAAAAGNDLDGVQTNFTTSTDDTGTLKVSENVAVKTGKVGEAAKKLKAIQVVNNKVLVLKQATEAADTDTLDVYVKNIDGVAANQGSLALEGRQVNLGSNVGQSNALKSIELIRKDGANPAVTTLSLQENVKVKAETLYMNVKSAAGGAGQVKTLLGAATTGYTGDLDNVLQLQSGSEFEGKIDVNVANKGIIEVLGNSKVTGKIGETDALNKVVFKTDGAVLTHNAALNVNNGLEFEKDGVYSYTSETGADDFKAKIELPATNTGTLRFAVTGSNVQVVDSAIGVIATDNTARSLKAIEAKGGGTIKFSGGKNVNIETFAMGAADTTIELSDKGNYRIGQTENKAGKGRLIVAANSSTLKSGTNLGSSQNPLFTFKMQDKNSQLTLEDNVNVYAKITDPSAQGGRKLKFLGNAEFDVTFGGVGDKNFAEINLGDAAAAVTEEKVVKLHRKFATDATNIQDKFVLELADNVGGNGAQLGKVAGTGTTAVRLANTSPVEMTEDKGNGVTLGGVSRLEIAGADVKVNSAAAAALTSTGYSEVRFKESHNDGVLLELVDNGGKAAAVDFMKGTKFVNDSAEKKANVKLTTSAEQTINETVGSETNQFDKLTFKHLTAGGELTVSVQENVYGSLLTGEANKNTFNLEADNKYVRQIGAEGSLVKELNVNNNNCSVDNVWAADLKLATSQNLTINKMLTTTGKAELSARSTLNFGADAVVDSEITRTGNNANLNFVGGAKLNKSIGSDAAPLNVVSFNGDGTPIDLKSSISSATINMNKASFNVNDSDVVFGGRTNMGGAKVNLGERAVTFKSIDDFGSGLFVTENSTFVADISADGSTIGSVLLDSTNVEITADKKIILEVNDNSDLLNAESKLYDVIKATNDTNAVPRVDQVEFKLVNNDNNFVKYEYVVNGVVGQVKKSNIATEMLNKVDGVEGLFASSIGNPNNNDSQVVAFRRDLGKTDSDNVLESVKRTESVAGAASVASQAARAGVAHTVSERVNIGGIQTAYAAPSAGDDNAESKYGVWVAPFYSYAEQSAQKGNPGFDMSTYGAIIGADSMVNDSTTVGAVFSYGKSEQKHKGFKNGDKSKFDTYLFGIYGMKQFSHNWFMQGFASYASSKIENSERRNLSSGKSETAVGSTDAATFGGEFMLGLKQNLGSDVTVIPMIGAAYSRTTESGYTETGTTFQNLSVSTKPTNKLEAIGGAKLQMAIEQDDMRITPEGRVFVRHDAFGEKARPTVSLDSALLPSRSVTPPRTFVNLGIGVNAEYDMYEFGVSYDVDLANKNTTHTGSLRLRVNI